ncbi:Unknown protein [Striga hermonthica]|uniref:Uncharacterized protein n=1 Tax=Striga hermonthica TaxID=68872 RepID=A0A9N7N169_STRHE|nr:Unknown protein [Striga hermonthica]
MGGGGGGGDEWRSWPPAPGGAPPYIPREDHWTHFDNSVNAVSFGFVATAILISMFLVMAIFEKLLRTSSPPAGGRRPRADIEAQDRAARVNCKLGYPSPKVSANAREVSVVMPGNKVPTFIAKQAPVPCPPERMRWPSNQQVQNQCNLHESHVSS